MRNPLRKGDKVILWGIVPEGDYPFELNANRETISEWVKDSGASVVYEVVDTSGPGSEEDEKVKESVFAIGNEHGACIISYGTDKEDILFLSHRGFWSRRGKNDWK